MIYITPNTQNLIPTHPGSSIQDPVSYLIPSAQYLMPFFTNFALHYSKPKLNGACPEIRPVDR